MKLGVRTFQLAEVAKTAIRADLLAKLRRIDPAEPTQEELQQGGITKLRYMQYREQQSSSATLGFRVDGISNFRVGRIQAWTSAELKKLRGQLTRLNAKLQEETAAKAKYVGWHRGHPLVTAS